jgi:hypothetical protein
MNKLIHSLNEARKEKRLSPVSIRLSESIREQARLLASAQSDKDVKFTETDVYRTAIMIFLSENSTDSRDKH